MTKYYYCLYACDTTEWIIIFKYATSDQDWASK